MFMFYMCVGCKIHLMFSGGGLVEPICCGVHNMYGVGEVHVVPLFANLFVIRCMLCLVWALTFHIDMWTI